MQAVTRKIAYKSRTDIFKVTPIGDIHFGAVDCSEGLLRACVKKIAEDEHHYWLGMGDYCELIGLGDPRLDTRELDPSTTIAELQDLAQSQVRKLAAILEPIKSRCLGLLSGNHEESIARKNYQDVHSRFCSLLETDHSLDLGYSAIVRMKFVRGAQSSVPVKIYAHHGAGAGRLSGSAINRIKQMAMHFPNCQIYVMGHVHLREGGVMEAIDVQKETDTLFEIPRAWGITGVFKRTYNQGSRSYAEKLQYPPTSLGAISFVIKPSTGDQVVPNITVWNATNGLPA